MLKCVQEMKVLGKQLINYSFPIKSALDDEQISCLKQREITLDGYELIVYYTESKYGKVNLNSTHIFGKYFTFLPFHIAAKVANLFLGNKELSLFELYQGEGDFLRKVYIWSNYSKNGKVIKNLGVGKMKEFNGLTYCHVSV